MIDLHNPTTWYGLHNGQCYVFHGHYHGSISIVMAHFCDPVTLSRLYLVCYARPYNLIINAGRGSTPDRKSPRYLPWLISVTLRLYYVSIWYSVLDPPS